MYLIDTNVWLERLLEQEHSGEVEPFLNAISSDQLSITDFAFHSIALILFRLDQTEGLRQFIQDIFTDGAVALLHSSPNDVSAMIEASEKFGLDFDDAYQYVLAEKHNLTLVSFDHHFDRTSRGRKTPAQILADLPPEVVEPEASPPATEN